MEEFFQKASILTIPLIACGFKNLHLFAMKEREEEEKHHRDTI